MQKIVGKKKEKKEFLFLIYTYSVGKLKSAELGLQLRFVRIATSHMAHTKVFDYFKHWEERKKKRVNIRDNILKLNLTVS